MPSLLLFGPARSAAGTARLSLEAATVGELKAAACERFGEEFARVLAGSTVWVNAARAEDQDALGPDDEVAVVPPVSGGA